MTLLSKKDILLIIVILAVGFSLLGMRHWGRSEDDSRCIYAEITSDYGVKIVYLDDDRIFYVPSNPNVMFEVRDGQVAFIKSDCLDQICVRSGFQGRSGQMATCLPNGLILSVLSKDPVGGLDVFVR